MKPATLLLGLVLIVSAGCASSGRTAEPAATQTVRGGSSVITREEIANSGLANMEDVIQRLRPQFLRGRGRTTIMAGNDAVAVYVDDVHSGTVAVLRNIGANGVQRVEFVSGPDTGFRFGMNHSAGVIHIITK